MVCRAKSDSTCDSRIENILFVSLIRAITEASVMRNDMTVNRKTFDYVV